MIKKTRALGILFIAIGTVVFGVMTSAQADSLELRRPIPLNPLLKPSPTRPGLIGLRPLRLEQRAIPKSMINQTRPLGMGIKAIPRLKQNTVTIRPTRLNRLMRRTLSPRGIPSIGAERARSLNNNISGLKIKTPSAPYSIGQRNMDLYLRYGR